MHNGTVRLGSSPQLLRVGDRVCGTPLGYQNSGDEHKPPSSSCSWSLSLPLSLCTAQQIPVLVKPQKCYRTEFFPACLIAAQQDSHQQTTKVNADLTVLLLSAQALLASSVSFKRHIIDPRAVHFRPLGANTKRKYVNRR